MLELEVPVGAYLVDFVDDIVAVVTARTAEIAQIINYGDAARAPLDDNLRNLALDKTEIVLLRRRRIRTLVKMTVEAELVITKPAVKYLGITLDTKLMYVPHIQQAVDKATKKVAELRRLMANVRGPRQMTR